MTRRAVAIVSVKVVLVCVRRVPRRSGWHVASPTAHALQARRSRSVSCHVARLIIQYKPCQKIYFRADCYSFMLKNEILRNVKQSLDATNGKENSAPDIQRHDAELKQSTAFQAEWNRIEPVLTSVDRVKEHLNDIKAEWSKEGSSGFYFYYAAQSMEIVFDKIVRRIIYGCYEQEASRKIDELGAGPKNQKRTNVQSRVVADSLYILPQIDTILDTIKPNKGQEFEDIPYKLMNDVDELINRATERNLFISMKECRESIDKKYLEKYEKALDSLAESM